MAQTLTRADKDECWPPETPVGECRANTGFNHMNAFGFGVPRTQRSKILPFKNLNGGGQQKQQQQQPSMQTQQQPNNWNSHFLTFRQQQHPHDPLMHMIQQNQNCGKNKRVTAMSDWTAVDPEIPSFRQLSSFPHQQQQKQQQQPRNIIPDNNSKNTHTRHAIYFLKNPIAHATEQNAPRCLILSFINTRKPMQQKKKKQINYIIST